MYIPMGVPPEPAVSAGLPAFNWYRASALVVPIRGKALNIFAAFAMGVIVLPVPAPQVWAGPLPACNARL